MYTKGYRVWGFALRASDFVLRATPGQDDPTSKVIRRLVRLKAQGSKLKAQSYPITQIS